MSKLNDYIMADHCVYLIQYHIVWCPKFRYSVLNDPIDRELKSIIYTICQKYGYKVKALEIMPDHIHIFVGSPHTVAPSQVVKTLKSCSARMLFEQVPWLKQFYGRCGSMWSRGYFISSIGCISEETVKRYIALQKQRG